MLSGHGPHKLAPWPLHPVQTLAKYANTYKCCTLEVNTGDAFSTRFFDAKNATHAESSLHCDMDKLHPPFPGFKLFALLPNETLQLAQTGLPALVFI